MSRNLTRALNKLATEVEHLERTLDDPDLAISVAKKVRRQSTVVIQLLAALRDNPHRNSGEKRYEQD